jgi:hypothetical protein
MGGLLAALGSVWTFPAPLVLDFTGCRFITAAGVAVLATLKLTRETRGLVTEIDWQTAIYDVRRQLGRWQLTQLFGTENHPWTDNAIPLFHQANLEQRSLVRYIDGCTVPGQNMPRMSTQLMKEVRRSFCEVFTNLFQHADSPIGGLAIGQLYPIKKEVEICICDGGVGLAHRIQAAGYGGTSPDDAIQWALGRGNSTLRTPNHPRGLGLYLLREFVKKNGGRLRIYANNGCLSEIGERSDGHVLPADFPGTLFELRLKIRDDVTYKLQSE